MRAEERALVACARIPMYVTSASSFVIRTLNPNVDLGLRMYTWDRFRPLMKPHFGWGFEQPR